MSQWKKYLIGEWNWKRPFKSIAFIYLSLFLFALGCSNQLIYQPPRAGYTAEGPNILLTQTPDNSRLAMSHFPAAPGMPTLLWSHGNAEDIGALHNRFKSFHAKGYGILAYDYPGYGISEGSASEKGCYSACETTWHYLTNTLGVKPEQIIIYGQSVGSGPACWLASKKNCAGLMLVSPFTSAFRTVTRVPLFPGDQYPNINRIAQVNSPLLIIHGDQDRIIPQEHGKKLYELHHGPKWFIDIQGAGHNDLFILADTEIFKALDDFRAELQKNPASPHDKPDA